MKGRRSRPRPESPPADAVLTQEKILAHPPQAPKRPRRPSDSSMPPPAFNPLPTLSSPTCRNDDDEDLFDSTSPSSQRRFWPRRKLTYGTHQQERSEESRSSPVTCRFRPLRIEDEETEEDGERNPPDHQQEFSLGRKGDEDFEMSPHHYHSLQHGEEKKSP